MNRFVLLVVAIPFAISQGILSQSLLFRSQAWGPNADGLRIGISAISTTVPSLGPQFMVALQNTSNADFIVNLGYMLANGKVMFPAGVRLALTDPAGNTRELQFFDRRYPGIAGRVDDFTVALRAGATYTLPVSLDQYSSPATNDFGVKLGPGRHRISARFEGRGATNVNLDMPGVALMHFWRGTAQSDILEFEVSPR